MSSEFKPAVVGYLPRKGVGHTEAFLQNLANFPTKHPLYLYSHEYKDRPGVIPLPVAVEDSVQKDGDVNANFVRLYNRIFYTAIAIAASHGITHFLFIEHDCRFGVEGWDEVLFQEFMRKNPDAACGGTPVIFNPTGYSREMAEGFEKYIKATRKRPMPMHIAAAGAFGERQETCLFPLAALAIYNVKWLMETFPEVAAGKTYDLAHSTKLHDQEIGRRLFRQFGVGVYQQVVWLGMEYSGYKDVLSDEDYRRTMLESGQVVAVHQIKSDWLGPVKT